MSWGDIAAVICFALVVLMLLHSHGVMAEQVRASEQRSRRDEDVRRTLVDEFREVREERDALGLRCVELEEELEELEAERFRLN